MMLDRLAGSLGTVVFGAMMGSTLAVLVFHRFFPMLFPEHKNWPRIRLYCWGVIAMWLLWTFVVTRIW